MATDAPKVTVHMVASLDFFIARKDGSVSWLETSDTYEKGGDGEDAEEFMRTVGCFVMGSHTYEQALILGWPYGEVPTIVVTSRDFSSERDSVEFYSGDLEVLVNERLKPRYRNIWLVGGAMLATEFVRLGLADDLRITVVPVILGDGIPFVGNTGREQALHLKDVTAYKNGLVELWYEIRKD